MANNLLGKKLLILITSLKKKWKKLNRLKLRRLRRN